MNIYDLNDKHLVELYQVAIKSQKYFLPMEQELDLRKAYNESFNQNEDSITNSMVNNLLEAMREEMADLFADNVSYNN